MVLGGDGVEALRRFSVPPSVSDSQQVSAAAEARAYRAEAVRLQEELRRCEAASQGVDSQAEDDVWD